MTRLFNVLLIQNRWFSGPQLVCVQHMTTEATDRLQQ